MESELLRLSADGNSRPSAWLLLVAGDSLQRGNTDRYEETPSEGYVWNSRVPNHANLQVGDLVALWDKEVLLGISMVEHIAQSEGEKTLRKCPRCGRSDFKARVSKIPIYRCNTCQHLFDVAIEETVPVTLYHSSHRSFWMDLPSALPGNVLRDCCSNPKSQLSIRQLDWPKLRSALGVATAQLSAVELELVSRMQPPPIQAGHRHIMVRSRIGQASFRQKLFNKYGSTCAISGNNPPAALDAAHLYSFASVSEHKDFGGILLRKDLHALFDRKLLSIDPNREAVSCHPSLFGYPQYAALDERPVEIPLVKKQLPWIDAHYTAFKNSYSTF